MVVSSSNSLDFFVASRWYSIKLTQFLRFRRWFLKSNDQNGGWYSDKHQMQLCKKLGFESGVTQFFLWKTTSLFFLTLDDSCVHVHIFKMRNVNFCCKNLCFSVTAVFTMICHSCVICEFGALHTGNAIPDILKETRVSRATIFNTKRDLKD